MQRRLLIALGNIALGLTLSGCSLCDGWFWQKNKSCGDDAAFVR